MSSGSTLSTSAAPNAAKAMALGHGERCLIARSSPFVAKWRIRWSSLCETRRAQSPDAPSPTVVEAGSIFPSTAAVHPITAPALRVQGVLKEPQAEHGEVAHCRCTASFPSGNDKHAGHVVTAVAVLRSGLGKEGVLEGAALVGHVR